MRYLAFLLSLGFTTALVLWLGNCRPIPDPAKELPRLWPEAIGEAPLDVAKARLWRFSGVLPVGTRKDWIRLSISGSQWYIGQGARRLAVHPLETEITLGDGRGSLVLNGWVAEITGQFRVHLEHGHEPFEPFQALEGIVRGPALANGIPAVSVSAYVPGRSPSYEAYSWRGYLYAEKDR